MYVCVAETLLWSGSTDKSIRVWDVGSGRCVGVLRAAAGGHSDAVTCLELLPTVSGNVVLSGGADGALKAWHSSGKYEGECTHAAMVTSLKTFADTLSGE